MQSHSCAKYLSICTIFGLMNAKQEEEKNSTHFMYLSQFDNICLASHAFMSFGLEFKNSFNFFVKTVMVRSTLLNE